MSGKVGRVCVFLCAVQHVIACVQTWSGSKLKPQLHQRSSWGLQEGGVGQWVGHADCADCFSEAQGAAGTM